MNTETDYRLVFLDVDGLWRECGHDVPKYNSIILSDYLADVGIFIPDYTQFIRIESPDYHFEYRCYGGRVIIDYTLRELY